MTETVGFIRTSQRAGNGASPASVEYFRISLPNRSPQRIQKKHECMRVRADADPALEDTICELNCFYHGIRQCVYGRRKFKYVVTGG